MQKKGASKKRKCSRLQSRQQKTSEQITRYGKRFTYLKNGGSNKNAARQTANSIDTKQKDYSRRLGVDEKTKTIVVPQKDGNYGLFQRRL